MADNVLLNAGTGGDTVAADDIAGVKHQRVKLSLGADGTAADAPVGGGTESGVLRVTIASDSTGVLSVDDNGGSLTVDGTVELGATTLAALETISVTALPSGTNNIGDVDIASIAAGDNNIGNVDIVSLPASTNTIEIVGDAAHDAAAAGNPVLLGGYASATEPADVSADGDVARVWVLPSGMQPITIRDSVGDSAMDDTNNALRVNIVAGSAAGGTSTADDADFTAGTTAGTIIQGVYESSPTSVTDGDVGAVGITATRAVKVHVASGGIAGVVEDAAAAGGEEGIMMLAVRRDSASSGVSADGDFAALSVDSSGNLRTTGVTTYTEDAASAGAESLVLVGAVRRDTAASSSGTDGDYSTLNTDANGRLHTIAALAASQTLATVTTVSTVTSVTAIGTSVTPGTSAAHLGKAEDAAHSSGDTGVMSLAVRTDTAAASSGTTGDYEPFHTDSVGALWTRSTGEIADDSSFTPGTSRVMPVGYLADETATDSIDEGDMGAARVTLDRKQIVTTYAHAAAGGCTPYKNIDVDETEDDVKTSAGKLYWLHAINLTTAPLYLKIYNNVAASVTVGTTVPDLTFPVPTLGDTNGAGFAINFGSAGLQFSTGICIAATTGLADNNSGAPAANALVVNCGYL